MMSGMRTASVVEQMPLTRAAHGTSQPSPPLGWCTVDEPLSTLNGWHGWWQKAAQAALGDAASASVRQEGMVSVRKEGKWCRRARLSVTAEAAAEVALLRGDNVLLTLQRCAAPPGCTANTRRLGVGARRENCDHNETAHGSGLLFQSKSM